MQIKQTLLTLALASLASIATAGTTVLTFDDLGDQYDHWNTSGLATWEGGGLNYQPGYAVSGDYIVHGQQIEVSFAAPVVFDGTYYNSWGGAHGGYTFNLYNNSNLVFQGPADTNNDSQMYWLSSGYAGQVNRIVFYGSSDGAVIDNLTYTTAPVPEPESYALLLAGLGLMGAVLRRRKTT